MKFPRDRTICDEEKLLHVFQRERLRVDRSKHLRIVVPAKARKRGCLIATDQLERASGLGILDPHSQLIDVVALSDQAQGRGVLHGMRIDGWARDRRALAPDTSRSGPSSSRRSLRYSTALSPLMVPRYALSAGGRARGWMAVHSIRKALAPAGCAPRSGTNLAVDLMPARQFQTADPVNDSLAAAAEGGAA